MLFLRLYEGKQEYTDTRVGLEGYLVLSTAKRHNVQEGSSGEVAPAMRVVLHLWHHGGLLPNTLTRQLVFVGGRPFSACTAAHHASRHMLSLVTL